MIKNAQPDFLEYFSNIIDSIRGSIYWKDKNSVYMGCNLYAAKMVGLANPQDIIGKTDYDLFPKNIADAFKKHDLQVITENCELSVEEKAIFEGKEIIQLSSKKPLYDKNKKIIGVVGNTIDITAEKNEIKLQIENKAQQEIIKAQEGFKQCLDKIQHIIQSYKIEVLNSKLGIQSQLKPSNHNITLTKRERETLYYLSLNKTPKEIATILSVLENKTIAAATIQSIIDKQLYVKFNIYNISQLIEKANILGLIPVILN